MIYPDGIIDLVNTIRYLFRESMLVTYNVKDKTNVFVSVLSA